MTGLELYKYKYPTVFLLLFNTEILRWALYWPILQLVNVWRFVPCQKSCTLYQPKMSGFRPARNLKVALPVDRFYSNKYKNTDIVPKGNGGMGYIIDMMCFVRFHPDYYHANNNVPFSTISLDIGLWAYGPAFWPMAVSVCSNYVFGGGDYLFRYLSVQLDRKGVLNWTHNMFEYTLFPKQWEYQTVMVVFGWIRHSVIIFMKS